jgi:predicted PurR-regulated permease PerM
MPVLRPEGLNVVGVRARPSPVPPPEVPPASAPGVQGLTTVVVAVVVVAALYLAREVLIPITLAVLLSFVLGPLMELLRRIRLGRVISALLAVVLALAVIIALGGVIGAQIAGLVQEVPRYQTTIQSKIDSLRTLTAKEFSGRIEKLGHQLQSSGATPAPTSHPTTADAPPPGPQPLPVVVTPAAPSALELGQRILEPMLSPVATAGIILVVAIFTLLQKEDLRDRLIRLFGSGDLHRTTAAMDDAARRLSRYFLTQLAINASFGVIVGTGLFFIGVPSPLLWGILGMLLRFVPYIGSYLAAALPVVLAAAVGTGWAMAIWTAVLYVATELIMGQAVEPFVYGHSTGLSPFSVVVAAIFWTWIWGPIGLILSTPLTLCLVVLGRHVEQLEFLDVLLGDRPALTPVESLYQRMLAADADEAEEHAERFLAHHSLSAFYDDVALQALQLAAADASRGVLRPAQLEHIREAVMVLIEELDAHNDAEPRGAKPDNSVAGPVPAQQDARPAHPSAPAGQAPADDRRRPEWRNAAPVLCIAGRGPLDEAASGMLAQLLGKHGIGARVLPHSAVSRSHIAALDVTGVAMVCISYLALTGGPAHLRYLLRRVRQHMPTAQILVGIWPADDPILRDQAMRAALGADHYVSSLRDAVSACVGAAETVPEAA